MNPAAYLEMAESEPRHWWFTGRRAILAKLIEGFSLPKNANILEVGCGTGGNLEMLSRFGKVSGFEMNADARAIASKKTNDRFDLRVGSCPDEIPFRDQRFDLICMFDVLEHIEEDVKTLKALKPLLAKNGRILLTVPAYQWLWGVHDEFLEHKRRYSMKMLCQRVDESGLHIIRMSYFNAFLFPIVVLARLKDRIFRSSSASGVGAVQEPLNAILKNIFCTEQYILEKVDLPFGLSLFAILQEK